MKHNVLGNSIFITICLLFFNSVYGQNCEERTLKKLESVYRSNLAQYKRIVRKTIQRSDEYRDSIDVAKPDWDVIYISTLPFTKRIKTVSYTHLRAHETVLDLVCRLLLEKKNGH